MPPSGPPQGPPPGHYGPPPNGPYGPPPGGPPPAGPPPGGPPPGGPPYGGPPYGGPPPGSAGGPPPGWTPPEWIGPGGPQQPRRRRKGVVFAAVAAVLAILIGGGAFATYQYLNGGGPQPAEALPADTLGYFRIDLDPSASQKVNAFRLLRRVPEFEDTTGISSDTEDLRKLMFETMIQDSDCGLSYENDVEPWIGDRAGFGVVPTGGRTVSVAAIQVSDQQAAQDAVDAVEKCGLNTSGLGTGGFSSGIDVASAGGSRMLSSAAPAAAAAEGDNVGFVGDYMLIADDADALPDIIGSAKSSPLSESEQFQSDMDALDGEGIASFWFDVDGLNDQGGSMAGLGSTEGAAKQIHTAFGAIRAGSDNIEYVMQATTDADIGSDIVNPIGELPDSTLVALSASGGGDLVDEYWPNLQGLVESFGGPSAYPQMLNDVQQETGLQLPDDLRTILGDNVTVAMDSTGMTAENLAGEDPSKLYFGARLTTDQAAIHDVVDRVNGALTAKDMPALTTEDSDNGLVVASNQDYAQMLAEGGDLASADGFDTAVPDASTASVAFYLDFDRLSDAMAQDDASSDDLDTIEPMKALGATLTQVDGGQRLTMRLVFD